MDELKLALRTRFMKNIITKILSKAIRKKTGYDMNIQINRMEVEAYDGKINIRMDVNAEMNGEDLIKLLESGDLI